MIDKDSNQTQSSDALLLTVAIPLMDMYFKNDVFSNEFDQARLKTECFWSFIMSASVPSGSDSNQQLDWTREMTALGESPVP